MSPGNVRARRGVLVIVAGGNIGLYADADVGVRAATLSEIAGAILDEITASSQERATGAITLRERSDEGVEVSVTLETIDARHEREALDSAQVDPKRWKMLAERIHQNYNNYVGFVILHGLDTMSYTASALSFMLANPDVPIVLTGAQRPLNYGRTDAIQNAISAIAIAASDAIDIHPIKEVCVYNHDTLFRGNRVTMSSSSSYRSFDSPNYPPLAIAGENIEIQRHAVRTTSRARQFHGETSGQVSIVDVFPGMMPPVLAHDYRGVLLRTYGLGTAPTSEDFLAALKAFVDEGIVVMNVTQARSGRISYGTDPVSLRLMEQGVVSGVDMTAEAAYAKMVVLLSEKGVEEPGGARKLADELQIALCGEQSQSVFNLHFHHGLTEQKAEEPVHDDAEEYDADLYPIEPIVCGDALIEKRIEHLQLRLLGVSPLDRSRRKRIVLKVKLGAADQKAGSEIVVANKTLLWNQDSPETMNFTWEIDEEGRTYVTDSDAPKTTVIRIESSEPIRWTRCSIAIFANAYATAP